MSLIISGFMSSILVSHRPVITHVCTIALHSRDLMLSRSGGDDDQFPS
jgi:hypothetical protein